MIGDVTQITPLTFTGDRWTFSSTGRTACADGAPVQSTVFDEVLLPERHEPDGTLTGTRRIQFMDPCPQ